MKATDVFGWIVAAIVVTLVYLFIVARLDADTMKEEIQELKKNTDLVLRYDSILTARERFFVDSLRAVRIEVQEQKRTQADENKRLRRQNLELQKQFDAIVLSGRPDF